MILRNSRNLGSCKPNHPMFGDVMSWLDPSSNGCDERWPWKTVAHKCHLGADPPCRVDQSQLRCCPGPCSVVQTNIHTQQRNLLTNKKIMGSTLKIKENWWCDVWFCIIILLDCQGWMAKNRHVAQVGAVLQDGFDFLQTQRIVQAFTRAALQSVADHVAVASWGELRWVQVSHCRCLFGL